MERKKSTLLTLYIPEKVEQSFQQKRQWAKRMSP